MNDDAELLRHYAERRDEASFSELVRRHLDLVYFSALRRCGGDAHQAEDVAQQVFTTLAGNAARLARHTMLTGWLYTTTRNVVCKAMRAERSRRAREAEAEAMRAVLAGEEPAVDWERLRPVLDEALDQLGETDRDVILLRFFESRPFGEIGRVMRVTEDAARMRVDRALGRLRALLERRGIGSTTAALALVLSHQTALAKPAGLAASVTASALAGSAAAGLGAAASLGFMSSTKMAGVTIAAALLLAASAGVNGYLLLERARAEQPQAAVNVDLPLAKSVAAAKTELTAEALRTDEPAMLRDKLRAAGASEATVRSVVEGILRRRYREKLSANRAEKLRTAWWRDQSWWWVNPLSGDLPPAVLEDRPLLREMVLDPMEKLFGPDPVELAEYEARFEFLLPEKRAAFVALEREHEAAMARLAGADQNSALGTNLIRERDRKRDELLASLTSAERAEYELRFSRVATALKERMHHISATEAEYRQIMAVVAQPDGQPLTRVGRGTREEEDTALNQIVAALGYDRAMDYVWAGAWEFPSYARVASEANLPASTPGRVLQLAAETIEQAIAIHGDASLTPAQKREAMLALQHRVRPALDTLLPPDQQQRVAPQALTWFTALGEGRYKLIPTTARGTAGGILSPGTISVESGSPAPHTRQFVVRRAPGS